MFGLYRFRPVFYAWNVTTFVPRLAGPLSLESLMLVPGTRNDENRELQRGHDES